MRKALPILVVLILLAVVAVVANQRIHRATFTAADAPRPSADWFNSQENPAESLSQRGQNDAGIPEPISTPSWRPPGEFAKTGKPVPARIFPRGENASRRYHAVVRHDIDPEISSAPPAVLAKSPEDGRFHLLPKEIDEHTLIAARMVFDPTSLDRIVDGTTSSLLAPTLSGEVLTLEFQKIKTRTATTHTLLGHVAGEEATSLVQIIYHDGILHGSVMRYDTRQEIEYRILADGHMMVRQLDHSTMQVGCATCEQGIMADVVDGKWDGDKEIPNLASEPRDPVSRDTPGWRTIDVTVGYTIEARVADGGNSQIEARIIASVDRMTLAFANSAITNTELVLLGTIEDPDHVEHASTKVFDAHSKLRNTTDGYLDAVSDFHHQLGSDLASIVVSSGQTGGVAGVATTGSWSSANARSQMTISQMTFEHELGHNLGCAHAWGDTSTGNTQANMGWRFQGASSAKYTTIMAYTHTSGWGGRILHFSNPNVLHPDGNVPTGCVAGYDATNDPTVDPALKPGYDGSVSTRGANNAGTIDTGDGNTSYGATVASNRAIRTDFEVHAPAAAAQWERGTSQTISFSGGDMDDLVTIGLYKGGVLHTTLAATVNPATHRNFVWEIPFSLPADSDYMIRVELNRNGSTLFADSGMFTVFSDPPYVTTIAAPAVPEGLGQISRVEMTFNVPMDTSTFSAESDILSFTDPIGTSILSSITSTSWSAENTVLTIHFTPPTQPGTYQLVLGSEIADTTGLLIDQDRDGATGESVDDRVVAGFTVNPPLIRYDNMDTDPGWTFSANNPPDGWAWGQPKDEFRYHSSYGIPNPTSGYNGANVIGYNLKGDYERGITATRWATTPVMDCSSYNNVRLRFQRWLGIYYGSTSYAGAVGDNAYIEVSNNGTTWVPVWHNTNERFRTAAWEEVEYDISAVADGQSTVYIRWGMGRTNSSLNDDSCGWNIDEVMVFGDVTDALAVTPAEGLASSGVIEGPFSPASIQYTLENIGSDTIQWSATKAEEWISLSAISGTLAPGATTTVTVSINSNAETYGAGAYSDLVRFTNQTTGSENTTRSVDLNILGPGTLVVTPAGHFSPSGQVGGPFSPESIEYTVSNGGSTPFNWTASNAAAWLSLDVTGGTLDMGESVTVTATIHENADSLAIGDYGDVITFTNTTNGAGSDTRAVLLTVNPTVASVTLGNLNPVYDGSPKSVSVTTNPPGLAHTVTYNGSATAPTNAETYAVVATITDPNYAGSASGNLVIAKASQSITFNPLGSVALSGSPIPLTASASSGLAVSYSSSNTAVATISGSNLNTLEVGTSTITASQAGNTNYHAATPVQQVVTVSLVDPVAHAGGPYKIYFGGAPLSLNGSASQPSNGATLTTHSWDLNSDMVFGDVTGPMPTAISYTDLVDLWGMQPGLNTIRLRVTDSEDKTGMATTTVELIDGLTWDANATGSGQTDGGTAWLNANQWWDGVTNTTWTSGFGATFGNGGNGGNVTLASPTTVKSLTFNSFSSTYNLGSANQTLTLVEGITMSSASGAVTLTSPLVLSGNQTWTNNAANGALQLLVNGAVNNNGFDLTIDGSSVAPSRDTGNVRIAGALSGAGGLIKAGPGVLWLQAASTHSGPTTVTGGVLRNQVNSLTGLPGGSITLKGGVIEAYWSDTFTRALGNGTNQIQITGGASGFSQHATNTLNVKLGNTNTPIQWGSEFFNPVKLVLQETTGNTDAHTNFQNALDLNGSNRTVETNGNAAINARATISGIISNSIGTAGLIKTGNGLLILTANNTYNGDTTVQSGTLRINIANTNNQSSTVSIAAGATLHLGFNGTDTVDKLFVDGTQLAAGVYKAVGSAASGTELAALAGTGTLTVLTDPPTGPGPLDHFVISTIASPQTVGTVITGITITAQDAANETATSFTGTVTFGGTAGITGTSANFVAGVLTGVSAIPANVGSDLTLTVNDGAGHTGVATFTVQSIYAAWAGENGLSGAGAAPNGNPDGDSLTNLQEFAFGMDPSVAGSGPIVFDAGGTVITPGTPVAMNMAEGHGVDFRAVFGRRKDHQAAGLVYTVEFSANLSNWVVAASVPNVLTGLDNESDVEAVSVPYPMMIPTANGYQKPTFFRVGVSGN